MQDSFANSPFKAEDFHHTGVIVKDMDEAIAYLESIGIGPFGMMGDQKWIDIPFKGDLHGQPAEWSVKISNANVGDHQIELLQPSGGPSALQEFLDEAGEGVHHIAYLSDDVKGELAKLVEKGVEVLTSANLDTGGFAYIKTSPVGMVIEIRARRV
ncbi:MAG: VOC family protein [Dehalococcoidales bacterium]|nr:VOC family protein [Dehalococcoidales bacterium]